MTWQRVARVGEVGESSPLLVTVGSTEVGIYRVNGELVAWRNVCPHMAAPVCRGTISGTTLPSDVYTYEYGREGEILQCPWHGWEFDLITGRHLAAGSAARLRGYRVRVQGDEVYVDTGR